MLEIRPDIDQAAKDFAELGELASRFGFDLRGTLDSLAESVTPVFCCDIDAVPAPGTSHLVAHYKLAERLQGALAALRARNGEGDLREIAVGQDSVTPEITRLV